MPPTLTSRDSPRASTAESDSDVLGAISCGDIGYAGRNGCAGDTVEDEPLENTASHRGQPEAIAPRSGDRQSGESDAGDPTTLNDAFIASVFPSLHRAAWKMTGDPVAAEDLAQETLIAAFKAWDSFDGRSSRSTWMHGILIRLTRKHFRYLSRFRRRLQRYAGTHAKIEIQADSNEALATAEWQQSVWARVAKLPRQQAEAIMLHYDQQLTYEEIAEAVGCAVGTAKSRVHQGLKRLRQSVHTSETMRE